MSVANGQPGNETTFNNAFVSKTTDSTTTGVITLNNTSDPDSGAQVDNLQQSVNETFDAVGMTGQDDLTRKDYSSQKVVTNGDSHKVAIGKLDATYHETTGHTHDGTAGNGPKISAADLANFNNYYTEFDTFTFIGASGTSDDVSTPLTSKSAGGAASTAGVITDAPNNRCEIRDSSLGTQLEDTEGQKVYGRLTESGGTWTLSYYTNEAGSETATSLSSTDIVVYFREVYTASTRPTIPADIGALGSLDLTADVVDASATEAGKVNTVAQTFAGNKTFNNDLTVVGTTTLDTALTGPLKAASGVVSAANIDLTTEVTGALPIGNGGTGQITAVAGFDALSPNTTKGDLIVHNGSNNVRLPVGVTNGFALTVDSAQPEGVKWAAISASNAPTWTKYTKSYTDFSTAATTNTISLYTAAAGEIVHGAIIKHSTAFSGGLISGYRISVGHASGAVDEYASAYDVFQAVADSNYQSSSVLSIPNFTSGEAVEATAESLSATLDAATAGSVDIWILSTVLP